MITLGISAFYHDSAAAVVRGGRIIAAAQEERFSRRKHDDGFPEHAIRYCLDEAGVRLDEVDAIGFYDKPLLTFDRLLETYLAFAPSGYRSFVQSIPIWVKRKLRLKQSLLESLNGLGRGECPDSKLKFGFHHHSHGASAFYPSPFRSAAVLVVDGVGEWATTTIGRGRESEFELLKEIRFPHSLGLLYAAFTYYLGFKVNEGEYKVMGLAPYGEPRYAQQIRDHLIEVNEDGSFRLNMEYFDYCTGLTMTSPRFDTLFDGEPPRGRSERLTQRHMDLARSVQEVTEEVLLRLVRTTRTLTGEANLCLAGGVALNCVANEKIRRAGSFDRLWIQPASGDAGGALGVAYSLAHIVGGEPRQLVEHGDAMCGSYLGPAFDSDRIRADLERRGAHYHQLEEDVLVDSVAAALAEEKVVGWFQGRMEFGPRALGNRSILGDPRSPSMQRVLNLKIKYRESFRPFAPAVLEDRVSEYFDLDVASPYMLFVAPVSPDRCRKLSADEEALEGIEQLNVVRSDVPAITHVDYSARVQTVTSETNPRFHRLLTRFDAKTSCPVLVNTSFNVRDEPIVCTPDDAYRCFMATEMDALALGDFLLWKHEQ